MNSLSIGDVIYIWRRDGIAHEEPLNAGQFTWVWRVVVTSIDPAEASNTFIGITVHINVLGRSKKAVKIVA